MQMEGPSFFFFCLVRALHLSDASMGLDQGVLVRDLLLACGVEEPTATMTERFFLNFEGAPLPKQLRIAFMCRNSSFALSQVPTLPPKEPTRLRFLWLTLWIRPTTSFSPTPSTEISFIRTMDTLYARSSRATLEVRF